MKKNEKKDIEQSMEQMQSYADEFLQPKELYRRQCVYISKRNHFILSALIASLHKKGLTVGGYIDNVITKHLQEHKAEINHIYRRERNDLI